MIFSAMLRAFHSRVAHAKAFLSNIKITRNLSMPHKPPRLSHHPRKKGPGRYNKLRAYSRRFVSDAHFDCSGNRKRHAPASGTGNWQGLIYESYAHADARTRARLAAASQQ